MFAATPWTSDSFKNVEFSAAVGPNWAKTSSTHLVVSPYETDSLPLSNVSNHALWKIGVGYHIFADQVQGKSSFNNVLTFFNDLLIELNLYHSSENVNGNVWQYQLPQFNNFSFNAPISSTRLMLDLKPCLLTQRHLSLYAIVGVGNSWNDVAYNETVTGASIPANSNYSLNNSTNSNFAYDLGMGLRATFTEHLSGSLEYLYTNLGNMSPTATSKNNAAIISAPTFHIFNNSLLLGISWKI